MASVLLKKAPHVMRFHEEETAQAIINGRKGGEVIPGFDGNYESGDLIILSTPFGIYLGVLIVSGRPIKADQLTDTEARHCGYPSAAEAIGRLKTNSPGFGPMNPVTVVRWGGVRPIPLKDL